MSILPALSRLLRLPTETAPREGTQSLSLEIKTKPFLRETAPDDLSPQLPHHPAVRHIHHILERCYIKGSS